MPKCLECKDSGMRGCDVRNSIRLYIICADFKFKGNNKKEEVK
jgi:hypothetical protein